METTKGPGPVFLLASERSGTNLLRRRLMEWQSAVFGPSPTHLLKHLHHLVPFYGSLDSDKNFRELIGDALSLSYEHFSPWEIKLDVDQVVRDYTHTVGQTRSLIRLLDFLNQAYAVSTGWKTYLCKDNHLFKYVYQIREEIPNARFVYLHRDPRDYTLSQINRLLARSSITHAARMWRDEQLQCLAFATSPAFQDCCYQLSYEQLIGDERGTIARFCEFLNVEMHEQRQGSQAYDQGTTTDWSNLNKATMTNNSGKYKNELSRTAIRAIEAIAWSPMKLLGYEPESASRPRLTTFYHRIEPITTLAWDVAKRPFKLRQDAPGRIQRVKAIRALQAKF